jgi:hypothetical protein
MRPFVLAVLTRCILTLAVLFSAVAPTSLASALAETLLGPVIR